jgi:hypothetical protein
MKYWCLKTGKLRQPSLTKTNIIVPAIKNNVRAGKHKASTMPKVLFNFWSLPLLIAASLVHFLASTWSTSYSPLSELMIICTTFTWRSVSSITGRFNYCGSNVATDRCNQCLKCSLKSHWLTEEEWWSHASKMYLQSSKHTISLIYRTENIVFNQKPSWYAAKW